MSVRVNARSLRLLAGLACLGFATGCPSKKTLAVFDLEDQSGQLSGKARAELGNYLYGRMGAGGKVRMVSRPKTRDLCKPRSAGDHSCLNKESERLGADAFLAARVQKPGSRCTLILEVYPRDGETALYTASAHAECNTDAMLDAIDRAVVLLGPPWSKQAAPGRSVKETPPVDLSEPSADPIVETRPLTGEETGALEEPSPGEAPGDDEIGEIPDKNKLVALTLYRVGNDKIRAREFKTAIRSFKKAIELDPSLVLAHRGLGICYAALGQNDEACSAYRRYLETLPADSKEAHTVKQIVSACD
jgi:tetratricopeptide (TPR) repeat protein